MNIYILEVILLAELEQSIEMFIMRVNTTIREKTPEMEIGTILLAVLDCSEKLFIFEEGTVFDVLGDQGQILVDDTAGTDIHMTYLGVTHLSVGKSDCESGCKTLNERALCLELVDDGSVCHLDSVILGAVRQSESVKYHKNYRSAFHVFSPL